MTSSISSKPAHVKKIIAGHRPLAPVGIMPCARPGPPPSEGLEQHRSSPGSSHPDDDFHRTSGILTRHFHRREALRLCSRPARQDSNLTGADRLAPPGKHLLRTHMMRPRHRRDICIRRQRLFQCPRLRLRAQRRRSMGCDRSRENFFRSLRLDLLSDFEKRDCGSWRGG